MEAFRSLGFTACVLLVLGFVASCAKENQRQAEQQAAQADHRAADEAAIRALDSDWVKAVEAKNADQSASFYADDGTLLPPGAAVATGKAAIRTAWAGLMSTPGFTLMFTPAKVEVSKGGDLAYDLGDYELTTNDKKGRPQTVKAKYVVVWGKQADGSWKVLVDAPTTTVNERQQASKPKTTSRARRGRRRGKSRASQR
ncbi:MAG: SgcJ/EcaC family oxidoreductase [Candidatus Acidiferrales bacterium]